jgi:CBS domain-containing protein
MIKVVAIYRFQAGQRPLRWRVEEAAREGQSKVYSFFEETVTENMTRAVKTASPEMTMRSLQELFAADDFNGYPVVRNGKLLGIVSKFNFLNCFAYTPSSLIPR